MQTRRRSIIAIAITPALRLIHNIRNRWRGAPTEHEGRPLRLDIFHEEVLEGFARFGRQTEGGLAEAVILGLALLLETVGMAGSLFAADVVD